MADGRDESPAFNLRKMFAWTEIFRCFQVALDPRKLLVAALGILTMSLGWWLLSWAFAYDRPDRESAEYNAAVVNEYDGETVTPDELKAIGDRRYQRDLQEWQFTDDLAGPGGRLRTLPWDEYRGPNPYLLMTSLFSGDAAQRSFGFSQFLAGTLPVLIEPLVKLLLPVIKFADPDASWDSRLYLLLVMLWGLAVWAFFGGIITRIAAVQLVGKDRIRLGEAVRFVANRYLSYLLSPLVPLGVLAVIVIGLAVWGLIGMIPIFGDFIIYGLLMPFVFLGGLVMAVLLVGLVGYPLMYTTISTEGSDTFDALSRSYNYVFQSPWTYLWYSFIAVVYGAVVTLFVVFMGSLTVYLGKWAVSQAPWSEAADRQPNFLFIHAPDSFGWRELFLEGSPAAIEPIDPETGLRVGQVGPAMPTVPADSNLARERYVPVDPAANQLYRQNLWGIETAAAWMVTVWLVLAFMLMLGFSYSYFWTASTMIYLLMRRAVDETEMDEIYIEEDLPDAPLYPPSHSVPPSAGPDAKGVTSLPTVTNPTPPPSSTLPMVSEPTSPPAPPVPPQGADTPRSPVPPPKPDPTPEPIPAPPPEPSVPAEKPMPAEPPVADEPTEDEEPTEENTAPDDDDDKKS